MIPEGWKVEELGKVADIKTGGTPNRGISDYWGGGIPWMSSGEVHQKYVTHTAEFITTQGLENSNARILPKGTVMIALNGQGKTRGKVAILEKPSTCNQSLAGIISNEKHLLPYFLLNYLENRYVDLRNLTGDDARNGLNLSLLRSIEIQLPPLPEQKRIAEVLGGVDVAIEATRAVNEQTKKIKQGLLQTLLTCGIGHTCFKPSPLGKIPKNWVIRKIEEILESCVYGISTSLSSDKKGTPILRMGNILEDRIRFHELKYADLTGEDISKVLLKKNDIVLNRTNSKDLVGKVALFKSDDAVGFASYIIRLRTNSYAYSPWLFRVLASPKMQATLRAIATPGVSQVNINPTRMRQLEVAVPPLEEQIAINQVFENIDKQLETETAKLASLQQLKKGLMHDLLTGRVRVQISTPILKSYGNKKQSQKSADNFCLTSPVEPLYKHALLRAEIASQFHAHTTFGAVKLEKLVDLATRHNGLDDLIDRTGYRDAAGPYDGASRHKIDDIFQKEKWFSVQNQGKGSQVKYIPADNFGSHKQDYQTYLGNYDSGVQAIINLLRDESSDFCEKIATFYAAWNDFLIDGNNPTDDQIITEAVGWHKNKKRFTQTEWKTALDWMRRNNLVPRGSGRKTKAIQQG